jgi:hypothetical protein
MNIPGPSRPGLPPSVRILELAQALFTWRMENPTEEDKKNLEALKAFDKFMPGSGKVVPEKWSDMGPLQQQMFLLPATIVYLDEQHPKSCEHTGWKGVCAECEAI